MATIKNAKKIQSKSRTHEVKDLGGNIFEVVSGESGKAYTVTMLDANTAAACTCDWAKYRPAANQGKCGCSHVVAVFNYKAQSTGAQSVSAWTSAESAERQHRHMADIGDGVLLTVRNS